MSIRPTLRAQLAQSQNTLTLGMWSIHPHSPITQPVHLKSFDSRHKWKKAATILAIAAVHVGVFWWAEHLEKPELVITPPKPVVVEIVQAQALHEVKPIQPVATPPVTEQPQTPAQSKQTVAAKQPTQAQTPVQPKQSVAAQQAQTQTQTQTQPSEAVLQKQDSLAAPVASPEPVAKVQEAPIVAAKGYAGYLSNPAPEYPEVALERGWEGEVILRVKVSPDGNPQLVSVQRSSGKKVLDDTAVKTVKRWKFAPAKQGNQAVEGWVNVPIGFQLPA